MGEGYAEADMLLMPFIDSANIACGGHAGDDMTMEVTVELALKHGVKIGAHPGFDDRENFGRRELVYNAEQWEGLVEDQMARMDTIVQRHDTPLHHVKLHGAMYHMACREAKIANAVCSALEPWKNSIVIYTLYGSALWHHAKNRGYRLHAEAFLDRRYSTASILAPRSLPHATISDPRQAYVQLNLMVIHGVVESLQDGIQPIRADTFCVHGDNPKAWDILSYIKTLER